MNETTESGPTDGASVETRSFDAEVHQLLKLMINSLYSNREIFLRELVSNASDALDKLRFEALTDEQLAAASSQPSIAVRADAEQGTLEVEDNGIGMSRDDVIENLGTIARSGTARFLEQLSGDKRKDAQLIGQFGVGFYSAFIVADRVVVETRRAGAPASEGVRWTSDGKGEYTLEAIEREAPGTRVVLHLAENHRDLLDAGSLRGILKHYSNHVAFPIRVAAGPDGDDEVVNDAQALWARPRQELDDGDYTEFYEGLTGDDQAPATWAHHHVEGSQRYSMLLYLPARAPFDLAWNRDDRRGVKLYIQRVFIMDAAEQLVPPYLRFLRGVVDSADLPLNVSREILQDSPLLKKIRAAVVKRGLDMIEKLADAGGAPWDAFQRDFGAILKEGLIEDPEQRDRIARLVRFSSTDSEDPHSVGLHGYLERARAREADAPDAIWYLTADSVRQAKQSPHLEAFRASGTEVLLLTDPIDSWVIQHLLDFEGVALKPATEGPPDRTADAQAGEQADEESSPALVEALKTALGDRVADVRLSRRLTDSASCVVDPGGLDLRMRRMLEQAGQTVPALEPELEVNPEHPLVKAFEAMDASDPRAAELASLLLEQALLVEGSELADPAGYVHRVNRLLGAALRTAGDGS